MFFFKNSFKEMMHQGFQKIVLDFFIYIHIKLVISTRYTNNWTIRKIIEYDDGIFSYNED